MAGLSWFELDVDFHDDPKVRALCSRLRNPLADSYVSRLYAYCYKYAIDRFDAEIAVEAIEGTACRWKGRRGGLFDALFASEVLERDGGKVVVHGVKERLAPHIAKRQVDAERQKRHREKVAAKFIRHADVTRDVTGDITRDVTRESRPYTNTNTDTNQEALAGQAEEGLGDFPDKLAAALGKPDPLGVGKNPPRVFASFRRWLDRGLGDECLSECVRLARERSVVPSHLAWWPGWLDTVPDADLDHLAARKATA